MGPLWLGLLTTAICTAAGSHVPVLRARQYRHGLSAGRDRGRPEARADRVCRDAIVNVAAFDFFFVPPRFTFAVSDVQYLVTFVVMLVVTLVIANLMASVRQQTRVAGARERRTALLYAMSRELAATRGFASMARVAVKHVAEVFDCQAVVLLPDEAGRLRPAVGSCLRKLVPGRRSRDRAVGADKGRRAGLGSDTLPSAAGSLSAARRRASAARRARRAAAESSSRAAAGATAPARDLRRPDRPRARARPADRGDGGDARRDGKRASAQHAARLDLARPAHAAVGHGGRGEHARARQRRARRGDAQDARAFDRGQGAGDVGSHFERARPHASRGRAGRPAARLADAG